MISPASALFIFVAVAVLCDGAAADQCDDLVAKAKAAVAELNRYASQADATTSKARTLAGEGRQAIAHAAEACKGTKLEAGLKFSTANIEGIEKALLDAKTERLHQTGIFPPPDEP
jgi:hypothetical protein